MPKIIENLQVTILDAARDVLFEHGFNDFSIRSVAKKLSIAPATIYNYYPSKESILEALIDDSWLSLMESIDRETADIREPFAALEKIFELLRQSMNPLYSHWLTPGVGTMPSTHPKEADILAKKQTIRSDLTQRIETVLYRCGHDTSYASTFASLFIMCSHHDQISFNDIVDAIQSLQK